MGGYNTSTCFGMMVNSAAIPVFLSLRHSRMLLAGIEKKWPRFLLLCRNDG